MVGARREAHGVPVSPQLVEVITVGDELLLGFTVDTNGAFLAQRLAERGIAIARRTAVGDTIDDIVRAVEEALDRTGAVITTGGLGPTSDDVTRDAVAAVFDRELRVDEPHLQWMRERWQKRFHREMPESNRRQAMIPEGARKLDNKHGSAPGIFIEDETGRFVVMLPGVPRELRGMTEDTLLPLLGERGLATDTDVIISSTLRTTGIAESMLADKLSALHLAEGSSLAYLPGIDGVDLRITVRASDPGAAYLEIAEAAAFIRERVGDAIYGEDADDLARVVVDACRDQKINLSVAESCTGGMLGARITSVPGSSDIFVGGVIAYSNEAKVEQLGVSPASLKNHGAVSEQVVREMALGAQKKFGTELALAITGIAGPGGGTPEKPVGLIWICAAFGDGIKPLQMRSWGDREEIRYRAAQAAMELARRLIV